MYTLSTVCMYVVTMLDLFALMVNCPGHEHSWGMGLTLALKTSGRREVWLPVGGHSSVVECW